MKMNYKKGIILVLIGIIIFGLGVTAYAKSNQFTIIEGEPENILWIETDQEYSKIWFFDNTEVYTIGYPGGASFQSIYGGIQVPVGTTITLFSDLAKAIDKTTVSFSIDNGAYRPSSMGYGYDFTSQEFVQLPSYEETATYDAIYNLETESVDQKAITFSEEGFYTLNFTIGFSSRDSRFDVGSFSWSTIIVSVGDAFSTDAPSFWAEEAVKKIAHKANYLYGIEEAFFSDFRKEITRLEFARLAMVLYKDIGGPSLDVTAESFTDCDDYNVMDARAYGLINGYNDGSFRPENTMSRAEIATLLMRVIAKTDREYMKSSKNQFTDLSESHWAFQSIIDAQENGFVTGIGNGLFNPSGTATREQALLIVQRIMDKYEINY